MNQEIPRFFSHDLGQNDKLQRVPQLYEEPADVTNWAFLKYIATGNPDYAHWSLLRETPIYTLTESKGTRLLTEKEINHFKDTAYALTGIETNNFDQIRELIEQTDHNFKAKSTNESDENGNELGEFIPDPNCYDTAEEATNNILLKEAEELLGVLSPKEKDVVMLRFGIGYSRQYTLTEVGEKYNVTRQRARQLEQRALNKLKEAANTRRSKRQI